MFCNMPCIADTGTLTSATDVPGWGVEGGCVMIGGVPTTQMFADEVGADAWGKDALDAVEKAKKLMGV